MLEKFLFRIGLIRGQEVSRDAGVLVDMGRRKKFTVTYRLPSGRTIERKEFY